MIYHKLEYLYTPSAALEANRHLFVDLCVNRHIFLGEKLSLCQHGHFQVKMHGNLTGVI